MVDFDKVREARKVHDAKRVERFGSERPALSAKCSRCGLAYGKHREVGRTYCDDEFFEKYPHLKDSLGFRKLDK